MRRWYWLHLIWAVAALLALTACDNKSTEPDDKQTGSLNDPQFQLSAGAFGMAEEYSEQSLDGMLDQMGMIDGLSGSPQLGSYRTTVLRPAADSFLATYHAESQYWVVYLRAEDSTGVVLTFNDSVQFRNEAGTLQWPDSTVNEIRAGGSLVVTETGTNNLVTAGQVWTMVGDIVTEGVVTVNGNGTLDIDVTNVGDSVTCSIDLDFTNSWVGVTADLSDDEACPTAGTITHNGALSLSCTDGAETATYADTWLARVTYNGANVSALWENSTYRWTYEGPCDELP